MNVKKGVSDSCQRYVLAAVLFFIVVYLNFLCHALAMNQSSANVRVKMAATIFPISDIAREIAGEGAHIATILPLGGNPHMFEVTPRAIKELEGVQVIFTIGHGFDDWLKGVEESLPNIETKSVDEGIDLIGPGRNDPHYWLSIANAKIISKNIARVLIDLDPNKRQTYESHLDRYLARLDQTHREIKERLSGLKVRKIITFHDGWAYFARDYGLEIVATVEASEGGEPTPRRLVNVANLISREQIKVLFSEPSVSKDLASSLAEDSGISVYELDPIGQRGKGRPSYLRLMIENALVIQEALSHGSR